VGDLSPHFSRSEFDCHDGQRANPDPELVERLEQLRARLGGKPLVIVSGFRDAAYNRAVGGAPNSQHVRNRAADIRSGLARVSDAEAVGFRGIGHCGGWVVHLDVRPGALAVFTDC
jgi:uncharacterized protein YcbK (DUF882 family)